eukprot:m.416068 g.416068  ORF g.416068 m.416068 type:complete len:423 (+) comp29825_c0_seq1:82-1350(+)
MKSSRCKCRAGLVAAQAPSIGVFCDGCAAVISAGLPTRSCRTCDQDLCGPCFVKEAKEANDGARGPHAASTAEVDAAPDRPPTRPSPVAATGLAAAPTSTAPPASGGVHVAARGSPRTPAPQLPPREVKAKLSGAMQRERERRRLLDEQWLVEQARLQSLEAARLAKTQAAAAQAQIEAAEYCTFVDGALSCAERDLVTLPLAIAAGFGASATKLDISWNLLESLESVAPFFFLEELMVDNGKLVSPIRLPELPFLRVLSLNNNLLTDVHDLVTGTKQCPRLSYLSVRKNPLCPDALLGISSEGEYTLYRQYLISQLDTLVFLDATAVTDLERKRAVTRFDDAHYDGSIVPVADIVEGVRDWVGVTVAAAHRWIETSKRNNPSGQQRATPSTTTPPAPCAPGTATVASGPPPPHRPAATAVR